MRTSDVIPFGQARSLSGHALHGSSLMRLVYMDEAGISNPKQEPFLVVAGVLIHADRNLIEIERYLDRLVAQYIPPEHQSDFVFHATELFNGGGRVFKRDDPRYPLAVRLEIASRIAAIPRKFGLRLAFGYIERSSFPRSKTVNVFESLPPSAKAVAAQVTAFTIASVQIDRWMRRNAPSEVCMLIVEDNHQARALIKQTHIYHQDRTQPRFLDDGIAPFFPLRKIKEDPLFQNKKKGSLLQVADFFAYTFKRFLMNDKKAVGLIQENRPFFAALEYERPEEIQRQIARSSRRRAS
jgi:Protein of unknown function (DUF3800)